MEYVNSLPHLGGLPVFVFLLHGTHPGDAGNHVRKALLHKGAREAGYFRTFGADFYFEYLKRGCLFSPDSPTTAELAAAGEFGRTLAARMAAGQFVSEPFAHNVWRARRDPAIAHAKVEQAKGRTRRTTEKGHGRGREQEKAGASGP